MPGNELDPTDHFTAPARPARAPAPGDPAPQPAVPHPLFPLLTLADLPPDQPPFPVVTGYTIEAEIGSGGMGVVYRARDRALDRDVAIKLLQPHYPADGPAARRFRDEARITGQLQHPAIPPVHQIGTLADGRPFLAMKLIQGETLAQLLERAPVGAGDDGPAGNRGQFVLAFAQVCQAVAYAHSHRVVHRDLKPANVMVGRFGEVQVMDWGLAKVLAGDPPAEQPVDHNLPPPDGSAQETDRWANPGVTKVASAERAVRTPRRGNAETQVGDVLGTPAFMSPEQAGGAVEPIDERADVFGLGAVLCAILTGQPPYVGPDPEIVRLQAIVGDTAEAFDRLDASGADPELVALCKRCLTRERAARPPDAGAVAQAVSAHLAAAEERARRAELDRVRAEGEARERRKRRRAQQAFRGAAVLLMGVGVVGVTFALLWRTAERAKDAAVLSQGTAESALEQLDREKRQTEEALEQTARQKALADRAGAAAAAARDDALVQRARAETARAGEAVARKQLEAVDYGRTVQVAYDDWRDNNVESARARLVGTPYTLRGWEWHHVRRLCNGALLTLGGHAKQVTAAAYSADGTRIVTGGQDATARVWDAATGRQLLTLNGHTDRVTAASFSTDGTRIVTASRDKTARVWDARTGTELVQLKGPPGWVLAAAFSPDGTRVVTAGSDRMARVWELATGKERLILKGHVYAVLAAAFSPDGTRIITAGVDGTARVWEVPSARAEGVAAAIKERLVLVPNESAVGGLRETHSAAFSPEGTRIVTGHADGKARVWDAATGKERLTLWGHTDRVLSAAFSPDGARIVTAGADETARVWDAATGKERLVLKGHVDAVTAAAFSPDGARVVTAGWEQACVWDARIGVEGLVLTAQEGTETGHQDGVMSAAFSPDGTRAVTASLDRTAKVWDVRTGAELLTLKGHTKFVTRAAFSPDGTRVVTGSHDQTARVWEVPSARPEGVGQTGKEVLTLKGHTEWIMSAAYSPDGTRIVTASEDRTARVWDAQTGAELTKLEGHTNGVMSAAFSPDGTRIVTASRDQTARVWDAGTGKELLALKGHTEWVLSAAYSPDGTRIVTASEDRTARVWDAQTGAELTKLKGHTDWVTSAAYSPDGSRIVTGSHDKTVTVWDARAGIQLLGLKGHKGWVASVEFSPDGSRAISGSWDKTARVWDARPVNREELERAPPPHAAARPGDAP
jgi:WD40 repeat protein/serine/threonine protein kinase